MNLSVAGNVRTTIQKMPYSFKINMLIVCFFAFLATGLIAPVSSNTMLISSADYLNHIAAIIQAKTALAEGQFPLRVMPSEFSLFRYPFYQFASPTTYTLAAIIYRLVTPSNPLMTFKILAWLGLFMAGASMYQFAFWLTRKRAASVLAGVVYVFAPYYIITVGTLGNINETLSLGLIPLILTSSFQYYLNPENKSSFLKVSLFWYLLITIHMVSFIYLSCFLSVLFILITLKNRRHFMHLIRYGIAYGFGIILSLWFLLPAYMYRNVFYVAKTYSAGGPFLDYHPTLSQLLFSAASINQATGYAVFLSTNPSIGFPMLAAFFICLAAYFNKQPLGNRRVTYWIPFLLGLFILLFILTWAPFGVSAWIPHFLWIGQYSFRFLNQLLWVGALLFAISVSIFFGKRLTPQQFVIGAFLVVVSATPWFQSIGFYSKDLSYFLKNPQLFYNTSAYAIRPTGNSTLIDSAETVQIGETNNFLPNTPFAIPQGLIRLAQNPVIALSGKVPDVVGAKHYKVNLLINNVSVESRDFTEGNFTWNIPIKSFVDKFKAKLDNKTPFTIEFRIANLSDPLLASFPLSQFRIEGFSDPNTVLSLEQVTPFCKQVKTVKICDIQVPASIKKVNLPFLYYPRLVDITVNGKPAKLHSTVYETFVISQVDVESGKQNRIEMKFTGLSFANQISFFAFIAWFLMWISLVVSTFYRKK